MRFHVLGIAHTKTNEEFMACAYTQKVLKLCRMLVGLGHEVIHYGAEGSEVPCEHVTVVDAALQARVYGDAWRHNLFKFNISDEPNRVFRANASHEIARRKHADDFLLCSFGNYQAEVANRIGLHLTVESGVGYSGTFAKFRVYESYAWMHHMYGQEKFTQGRYYDCVIPNYYEVADFPFFPRKQDYYAFIGRLVSDKGVQIAIDACRVLGARLRIAGQGNLSGFNTDGVKVEHVGIVDKHQRAELVGNAIASFVPTMYLEPFGGVNVESQLYGTPVVTSDWGAFPETVIHGVTGYRCRTLHDFVYGAANAPRLDPHACRQWAAGNYSTERVARMYDEYFRRLYDVQTGPGWTNPEGRGTVWLAQDYSAIAPGRLR